MLLQSLMRRQPGAPPRLVQLGKQRLPGRPLLLRGQVRRMELDACRPWHWQVLVLELAMQLSVHRVQGVTPQQCRVMSVSMATSWLWTPLCSL